MADRPYAITLSYSAWTFRYYVRFPVPSSEHESSPKVPKRDNCPCAVFGCTVVVILQVLFRKPDVFLFLLNCSFLPLSEL